MLKEHEFLSITAQINAIKTDYIKAKLIIVKGRLCGDMDKTFKFDYERILHSSTKKNSRIEMTGWKGNPLEIVQETVIGLN